MSFRSNRPRLWIASYYPSFDGLRGLAATMVVFCHAGELLSPRHNWTALFWGNDLFFVLSGFLITGILVETRDQDRFFSNFYKRRALRIFPLYYGFFAVLFLASLVIPLVWNRDLLSFCFYVGNLVTPMTRQNPTTIDLMRHHHRQSFMNLGPLWSLCVEEQFYLLWPLVIFHVKSKRQLIKICCAVIPLTLALRTFVVAKTDLSVSPLLPYWSTYTRWDTLLFGAWLALYLRTHWLTQTQLRRFGVISIVIGVTLFLGPLHFDLSRVRLEDPWTASFGLSAVALLCTGIVILSLDNDSVISRMAGWPILRSIGRISYGVYFFHALAIPAVRTLADEHIKYRQLFFVADVLGTCLLASLSFRYWESPFLRLKDRWAPQSTKGHLHVPTPQPAGGDRQPNTTLAS